MEDDLKKNKKWRRPKIFIFLFFLMEDDPQQIMQPKAIKGK